MKTSDCIFFQMAKATQSAIRFWSQKVSQFNVTAAQSMVLMFLFEQDAITSRELGDRTQLDSATLTGIIDRLESIDLLERKPNPGDRRAIMVCLTNEGRDVAKKLSALSVDANTEFLESFTDTEEEHLRNFLQRLRSMGVGG